MAGRTWVTILHISDIQFGRNHRFGRLALPSPDDQFDSIFARLRNDLDGLKESHGLAPDLIILSGDIAEWGKTSELNDAYDLLDALAKHLNLTRRRIVVVPGNHDINRGACEAYFKECETDDQKPLSPYWPKWKQYSAFFQRLYKDEPDLTFTPDQPWTLFKIDELQVVVAGLNSTTSRTCSASPRTRACSVSSRSWIERSCERSGNKPAETSPRRNSMSYSSSAG